MTAEEMFEELGYKKVFENEEVLRYRNKIFDVEFWKVFKSETGEKIRKKVEISNVYNRPYLIDIKIFNAINKQIEELGWSDK